MRLSILVVHFVDLEGSEWFEDPSRTLTRGLRAKVLSIRKLSSKAAFAKGTGPFLAVASGMRACVERNFIVKHACHYQCTDCCAKQDVANLSSTWPTRI